MNMERKVNCGDREAALEAALREEHALIERIHGRIVDYLPGDADKNDLISDVIEMIDNPDEAAAQERTERLLRQR